VVAVVAGVILFFVRKQNQFLLHACRSGIDWRHDLSGPGTQKILGMSRLFWVKSTGEAKCHWEPFY
jgi:hypothetical protein